MKNEEVKTETVKLEEKVAAEVNPKTKPVAIKPKSTVAVKKTTTVKVAHKPVAVVKAILPLENKKSEVKISVSQEIWNAIKERELGLFGLPGQTVEKYCSPMDLDPTKCMLKYKVSSVIPALENVVNDFNFETSGNFLIISKKE